MNVALARDGGQPLLIATRNSGKLAELLEIFESLGRPLVDLEQAGVSPSPDEDGVERYATFEENAVAKARFYCDASGGLTTVADDSGLEVASLGGAPGVRSRRWAGVSGSEAEISAANNAKLIAALERASSREARFVCVVALAHHGEVTTGWGAVSGRIARTPRGPNGFGYDPLFEAEELGGRTFGEASHSEKRLVSHRTRAFRDLVARLTTDLTSPPG